MTDAAPAFTRAQLEGAITTYLDALAAHDPSALPLADGCRFTENGVTIPLGEALWVTLDQLGDYRVDYIDVETGQAAAHVSFVENGLGGLLALRLKVVGGLIAEIETILYRGAPLALAMPPVDPIWFEVEAQGTRLDRAALALETENYLRAVSTSDGTKVKFNSKSALRLENGSLMAIGPNDHWPHPLKPIEDEDSWFYAVRSTLGMPPGEQLSTGIYSFITSYDNARFPLIDVERQVVFGVWNFRRRGDVKGATLNGKYYPHMERTQFPNENLLGQAFKYRDGGITRVQGVFLNANVYRAGTGWDAR
ncbi:hypothetical protein G4G27_16180 [Sphingomonas sp. So64.6b]|uniref:hypothetical protein n=1 Tax=Sphingomonas sp. So64.6b TaxID=2997354 RepID=UPI0016011FBD|nr:hypothetical protein [Sphingomonas sp. So64.6b]QNA85363.1 hypothetical protein G4G27_16180 [Sphingomonas sp. So64.6b]